MAFSYSQKPAGDTNMRLKIDKSSSNNTNIIGGVFDKVQLTKLLIHSLKELGYSRSAISLQEESGGIQVESTIVQRLFNFINNGRFQLIDLNLLLSLPLKDNPSAISSSEAENNTHNLMKIDNMLSGPVDSIKAEEILNVFTIEYNNFEAYYKNIGNDMIKLSNFLKILEIILLICKELFIELIFTKAIDTSTAVLFLRNTIRKFIALWEEVLLTLDEYIDDEDTIFTPEDLLRELSSLLTNPSILNDPNCNSWKGSIEKSRDSLIEIISTYINPNDLVPKGRLIALLKQSIKYQRSHDISDANARNDFDYMDVDDEDNEEEVEEGKETFERTVNLLQDNPSDFQRIRFKDEKTLVQNADEIWYLQFSPDGKYLASASADSMTERKILIYDVENDFQVYKILEDNPQSVLYLSFSPDSKYLVSCPFNEMANIYDIHSKGEPTSINPIIHNNKAQENQSNKNIVAEIIHPIDSFQIPNNDSGNASPSSPGSVESPTLSITNGTSSTETSPRIWCCDWFRSEEHKGKFIVGSPDRDVVIYDMTTKSIIFSFAQKLFPNNNATSNSNAANGTDTTTSSNENRNMSNDDSNHKFDDYQHEKFPRIHDLKLSYDDKFLILMTYNGTIDVYDLSSFPDNDTLIKTDNSVLQNFELERFSRLEIDKNMTCISLPQLTNISRVSIAGSNLLAPSLNIENLVLVSLQNNEIQLWDFKENLLIQKYYGQRQEKFIIRSCFGYNNKLVVSGSEDGKVYVWDRLRGNIIDVLSGHVGERVTAATANEKISANGKTFGRNCNVVAWNPVDKSLFASGGDDGYIKIWRVIKE
ncbi:hypothetical protein KAFR_0D00320 [Kazachstania africana CBS 2517]|uniref:Uncharacterized protein n=1 Tax=Kazachstania africana (strain ATCC 22294 / BCRC 22015 / CBS 2517 / CECT 1963 / NBRC 1671 / NRRL Y-8276) TaxID=1071382 RepID=H2ATH9_KAZAF|nr:hypothetical protein KAFR_0D00320 [Kazachstania africana CBS 2517]CCF57679.1 hypothetical protein KAFR_0D00320 [Kazachstania africana CBS 2517]